MKRFEELFNDDNIINYICKVRAKLAKQRNKKHLLHLLTDNSQFNYHKEEIGSESQKEFLSLLDSFFPPRKKWKKLGEDNRFPVVKKSGKKKKLNSVEKNEQSLIKTIHFYRSQTPQPSFIKKLYEFVETIK